MFLYVPTVIFGHLRLLAGMVRANRPWRLAARLYGVLAAAFAAGAYGIVASDMWRLSAALSWWRLLAVCLASLAVTIVAVIVAHELWERAPDSRARAQVLLFNVTTVLTVTIGIASLYAALFVLVLAGAALVIAAPVLADALGRDTSARDYVTLAWFAASLATVAGGLGTVLESDTAVRGGRLRGNRLTRRHGGRRIPHYILVVQHARDKRCQTPFGARASAPSSSRSTRIESASSPEPDGVRSLVLGLR